MKHTLRFLQNNLTILLFSQSYLSQGNNPIGIRSRRTFGIAHGFFFLEKSRLGKYYTNMSATT